jgi:hypothetical protein
MGAACDLNVRKILSKVLSKGQNDMTSIFKIAPIFAMFIAAPALSCPQGATPLVSCSLKSGSAYLETCLLGNFATYAYGKTGQRPDLALARPVQEVEMTPWPGVGRSIWEDFQFRNGDVSYRVFYSIDRFSEGEPALTAGVMVEKGEETLAELDCDPGTIDAGYPLPLWDAQELAAQARN